VDRTQAGGMELTVGEVGDLTPGPFPTREGGPTAVATVDVTWLADTDGPMKHIGIVAVSAEGAALCYRTVCLEGAELLGPHDHPEISLHGFSLGSYQRLIDDDRWDAVGEMLLESAAKLVRSGAQLLIRPDNTVHQGLDLIRDRSPAPWIHIAEEVCHEARRRGFKRLGILGTRFLMEGPVYRSKLAPAGIDYRVPNSEQRTRINQIIYDELVNARFLPESRAYLQNVIRELGDDGCDAVALACTEIPLLIGAADSPLPILDSTRILARAALRRATSGAES
jgi:aspartate racemase